MCGITTSGKNYTKIVDVSLRNPLIHITYDICDWNTNGNNYTKAVDFSCFVKPTYILFMIYHSEILMRIIIPKMLIFHRVQNHLSMELFVYM